MRGARGRGIAQRVDRHGGIRQGIGQCGVGAVGAGHDKAVKLAGIAVSGIEVDQRGGVVLPAFETGGGQDLDPYLMKRSRVVSPVRERSSLAAAFSDAVTMVT